MLTTPLNTLHNWCSGVEGILSRKSRDWFGLALTVSALTGTAGTWWPCALLQLYLGPHRALQDTGNGDHEDKCVVTLWEIGKLSFL